MPVEVIPTVTDEDIPGNKQIDEPVAPTAKPMVGIIYPPPEVRNIVDKTAGFVARNGPEFEHRIRQNEINNAKFNFLNHGDPYHAYFRHKVQEFLEGKAQEPSAAPALPKISSQQKTTVLPTETVVLKEPPAEPEFMADPPSISAIELDIVKLTAQFVARNGRQFLTSLMNREQRNYNFDFLRPQHSMFTYFTKLVEQYTKILIPPKDLLGKLRDESELSKKVMDQASYRVQWAKQQEAKRRKEEEEKEKERVSYAQIDWHGFVVVETVDFQSSEQGNFPPPLRPDDIGRRILAEKRYEQFGELEEEEDVEMEVESEGEEDDEEKGPKKAPKEANKSRKDAAPPPGRAPGRERAAPTATPSDQNTEVQDMDEGDSDMEESDEDDDIRRMSPPPLPAAAVSDATPLPPPLPPLGDMPIRKNYDPKAPKQVTESEDNYLISPITGEKIASSKMQEHMRIGLLDPRWIEQRDRQKEKAAHEEVYAPGMAIEESLKLLAERRTDIFGEGDVETQIGKKLGEEEDTKVKQKVIWDGHSASMEATARKAQANISIDEQIAALHRAQGLLPDKEKEKIGPQPVIKSARPIPPPPKPPQSNPMSMPPSRPPVPISISTPQPPFPPRMMVPAERPSLMHLPPRHPMAPRMPSAPPMGVPRMSGVLQPGPPLRFMNPGPRMGRPMSMGGQPMGVSGMPGGPPSMGRAPPPPVDEPPAKKQKTEESLMPEEQFLARNKSPVTFNVVVPPMPDKPEWKCSGQMLQMTLPLTDTISVVKAKIFEETSMPAGKQKLQFDGLFVKDSNSLAFYNFLPGCTLQLGLKERGGRKR